MLACRHGEAVLVRVTLTAVFERVPEGFIAYVEELPGANTQGATLEDARANLQEAVELVLEAHRDVAEEDLRGRDVIRESLRLGS
jgi:predicted RNase H-like HicB family nuclease